MTQRALLLIVVASIAGCSFLNTADPPVEEEGAHVGSAPDAAPDTGVDGDGDGVAPRVCGGQDCNDAQPLTFPGAPELCDGTDNSCDGVVDTALAANACASDQICSAGACLCLDGKTECASGCVEAPHR